MASNEQDDSSNIPLTSDTEEEDFREKHNEAYLQRHHPFFFAYNQSLSKLQISFKTPLIKNLPLYFGYTQIMFWELNADSKPFKDSTYNPQLFYRVTTDHWDLLKGIDLSAMDHTSNGRDGLESRSFERASIRANFEKKLFARSLSFYIQVSHIYGIDEGNYDIRNYIGPYAIGVSIYQLFESWLDKSEISIQMAPGGRNGERFALGGYQASWSFRPGGLDVIPSVYLQFYSGYAETLINYNSRVNIFRVGFIF